MAHAATLRNMHPTEYPTVLDLRPQELRFADPLEKLLPELHARAVTLDAIEKGQHGLTAADGPVLVLCERGVRSPLAARFLQADGIAAEAYPGGVPGLKRMLAAQG